MAAPIILRMDSLFLNVGGFPLTATPATGTIATVEKISGRTVLTEGRNGTSALTILGGTGYRFTVMVLPHSADDAFMMKAMDAMVITGRPVPVGLTYQGTEYVSGACGLELDPVRNFVSDTAEFVSFAWIGTFTKAVIGAYIAPPALTADEINAL